MPAYIELCMKLPAIIRLIHRGTLKNVALYFCLYHCQLLADFHIFSGTLCRQFAI